MISINNPWAGLSSYQDPQYSERPLEFYGREDEIYDVTQMVTRDIFVTLYGKSGIGKTSLLNAGVFPSLRKCGFVPVRIRLNMEAHGNSFQACIIHKLEMLSEEGVRIETIPVVDIPSDETAQDYLWSYFARTRFFGKDNNILFPVLALDQFEEIFEHRRIEAETLLCQIAFMMDENHSLSSRLVDGSLYEYDYNFRFLASIREDDLYKMEDSIDFCYLPDLKKNRYRLRNLSISGARDVILKSGNGLFVDDEQDSIVKAIMTKASENNDQCISTNMLSLICNRLFEEAVKSKENIISFHSVETFLKDNPLERYFLDATSHLSFKEMAYLEDKLIDDSGRRDTVSKSALLRNIRNGAELLNGEYRILQMVSRNADDRVELIHDSFCGPLLTQKERRSRRKRTLKLITTIVAAMLIILGVVFIFQDLSFRDTILTNQSRFVSEKALTVSQSGNSYLARVLAIEVLPKDLCHPDRPYTPEAEHALREACLFDNAILYGHQGEVNFVKLSPDYSYIASASEDGSIRLWDALSGKCTSVLTGHLKGVSSVCFSPEGKFLASSSHDGTIKLWNVATGQCISTMSGHTDNISSICFSGDGNRLLSSSGDSTIIVWNVDNYSKVNTLIGHEDKVTSAVYSPNGEMIASSSFDNTVRLWNVSGVCKMILRGHSDIVSSVQFSPNGKHLVSSSWDNTLKIWNTVTGECENTLTGHSDYVCQARYNHDGSRIISASSDQTIRIWDAVSGKCMSTLYNRNGIVNSVEFSKKETLLVAGFSDKTVRIIDHSNYGVTDLAGHSNGVNSVKVSKDANIVVSSSWDRTIKIWDANTGNCLKTIDSYATNTVISPDGQFSASVSDDTTVGIWDNRSGETKASSTAFSSAINSLHYSPDGKKLIVSLIDGRMYILSSETGAIMMILQGHGALVNSVRFSPDGAMMISVSMDNTIKIWDIATGDCKSILKTNSSVDQDACIMADGRHVLSVSDNTINYWNIRTHDCIRSISVGNEDTKFIIISPDGGYAMLVQEDNTIEVLETRSLQVVLSLRIPFIIYADFSQNGRYIIVGEVSGVIHLVDFKPLQTLIDSNTFRFANRSLTCDERRNYYLE